MIDKRQITEIVEKWLEDKEYFLTDLTIDEDNRIVVEIDHKDGVWIEDCVELSKFVEANLNRDKEDFELEVGSAGLGQPFKVLQQYINHIGKDVEVIVKTGVKFIGILKDADDRGFVVTVKRKVKEEGAKRAKLVDIDETYNYKDVKSVSYYF